MGCTNRSGLASAASLIQDAWGEMFFLSLDLAHVENNLLRCYEIAGIEEFIGSHRNDSSGDPV
jgi:hypothetical protein